MWKPRRLTALQASTDCCWDNNVFARNVNRQTRKLRGLALRPDFEFASMFFDRLCGLVVRVPGYRSGGPGSIPALPEKKVVGMERGPLSLVSTAEELRDRKVAAPV
jgi:hypothetical protein